MALKCSVIIPNGIPPTRFIQLLIFYMRHTQLAQFLNKSREFGKLIHGSVSMAHGLATKAEYAGSWRSDAMVCPKGIFEVISIHPIDLLCYTFGNCTHIENRLTNLSGVGTAPDTAFTKLKFDSEGEVDIFASYSAPYKFNWGLVFENGLVEINENGMQAYSPRDTFNEFGFFERPPIDFELKLNHDIDNKSSLENSVKYF